MIEAFFFLNFEFYHSLIISYMHMFIIFHALLLSLPPASFIPLPDKSLTYFHDFLIVCLLCCCYDPLC